MEIIAFNKEFRELYPFDVDVDFEAGDYEASNDFEVIGTGIKEQGL